MTESSVFDDIDNNTIGVKIKKKPISKNTKRSPLVTGKVKKAFNRFTSNLGQSLSASQKQVRKKLAGRK